MSGGLLLLARATYRHLHLRYHIRERASCGKKEREEGKPIPGIATARQASRGPASRHDLLRGMMKDAVKSTVMHETSSLSSIAA
jgi:hypothetical protein